MSLLAWYNARLASHPYTTRASQTFATYFCSDCTAQALEGDTGAAPADRAARALKFASVGGLWVGPLLTHWFIVMDRLVPGRSVRAVGVKLVADQVLQGPFMIGSMFGLCALSNGATLAQIERKLRDELYSTWVSSVYVWAPVQVFQQAVVPLRYRVAVANGVSYFWDTYLSLCMMPHPAEATGRPEPEVLPPTAKLVRRRTMV
jgi:hypothetical protein